MENTIKRGRFSDNHVDAFNFIRVVAIIMVFMQHTLSEFDLDFTEYKAGNFYYTFPLRTPAWAGVWILFILSGFLAGKSYAAGRYKLTLKDTGRYYLTRLKKTWFPHICFIIFICLLFYPNFLINNPKVILNLLTFTYIGKPGVTSIGHLWFISTVMWFYIITPFAAFLCDKIKNVSKFFFVLFSYIALGAGLFYRLYALKKGWEWYDIVYVPAYSNLDLYLSGFFFSYYTINKEQEKKVSKTIKKIFASVFLIGLIELNCYIYVLAKADSMYLNIYRYLFPFFYGIACLFYLSAFDYKRDYKNKAPTFENIKKNPFRIIDWFSQIAIYFYFFHIILKKSLAQLKFIKTNTFSGYLICCLLVLIFGSIVAYGYSKIFKFKPKKKTEIK